MASWPSLIKQVAGEGRIVGKKVDLAKTARAMNIRGKGHHENSGWRDVTFLSDERDLLQEVTNQGGSPWFYGYDPDQPLSGPNQNIPSALAAPNTTDGNPTGPNTPPTGGAAPSRSAVPSDPPCISSHNGPITRQIREEEYVVLIIQNC